MTRSAPFRIAAFTAALLGLSAVGLAADDDFEFAEALYRRGYLDLAEEKFNELIDKGGTRKGDGQFGLALLKRFSALKEAGQSIERLRMPYSEVMALFDQADGVFAEFIKKNVGHTRVLDAKLERARLLQSKAEYGLKAIEMDWLPEGADANAVRKQVADAYDTAVNLLKPVEEQKRKLKEELYKEHGADSDEYMRANHELAVVWLNRLVALYGKGASLPAGDSAGKGALTQVLQEIDDYLWDYEDRIQGVWALHYSGLCRWKLEQNAEAFTDLKAAATLADFTENVAVRKVSFDSYARLCEFAIDAQGEWTEKVLALRENYEGWPKHLDDAPGQKAALAFARLLASTGDMKSALEIGQQALSKASVTGLDRLIGGYVSEWLGQVGDDGGGITISPGDLENVYRAKWKEEDFAGCIRAAQAVIQSCTSKEEMDQYGWKAWEFIGNSYGVQKRWWACYQALETIEKAWKIDSSNEVLTTMTTQNTAFGRVKALTILSRQTKSKADKDLLDKVNEAFLMDHPDSPEASDVGGAKALAEETKGNEKRRAGDAKGAEAHYRAAIKLYTDLMTSNLRKDYYEAKIADIHRKMGDFAKAIDLGKQWLAKERGSTNNNPKVVRARARGKVTAIRTVLQSPADMAAAARKEHDKAGYEAGCKLLLEMLDLYEAEFLASVQNGELTVVQWRAEGLIGTGQVEKAEALTSQAAKDFPDSPVTRYLAANTAAALKVKAYYWKDRGDDGKFTAMMIRAARLREFVVDTSTSARNPASLLAVAEDYQKGGNYPKAEALLQEALALYEAAGSEEMVADVRIRLIDLLVDQGKFDEAIPELEKRLVEDDALRAEVIKKLQAGTDWTAPQLKELLTQMSRSKPLLNALSKAYLAAKDGTQQRLIGAINLAFILRHHHPKDKKHDAEYIEYTLRLAQGYYEFGVDFKTPQSLDNSIALLKNGIVIPGMVDSYEQAVPGAKKRIESLLSDAERERSKLR